MAHIIVETNFDRPISDAELMDVGNKLKPCVEERHGKRLRSYLSSDRRRMICHYDAPDAETVREAIRSAGLPQGEVWTAGAVVKIEDYPDFLQKRDKVRARLSGKSP